MGRNEEPSYQELVARLRELEAELDRLRKGSWGRGSGRAVIVPEALRSIFDEAQTNVGQYFDHITADPNKGTIEIWGERYVLVRAAALSYSMLNTIRNMYADRGPKEALAIGRDLLFDMAHIIGLNDARSFHEKMRLEDPLAKLSAGPVHFSHTGWALVEILPESSPTADDNYVLIYNHPFSFEADAWIRARQRPDFPVCIMNAGYSSGWCEESFGIELTAVEIACRARGDANCTFVMAPPHRIEEHLARLAERFDVSSPTPTDEIPAFFDRKRTEDAFTLKHQQLLSIFDSIDELVYVSDPTTHEVLYANQKLRERYGDVVGARCHDVLGGRESPCPDCTNERILGSNEGAVCIWDRRSEVDGRWYHCIDKAIHWPDGRVVRFELAIDITERKRAEQAAQRLQEALLQSQKLETLGTLASGVTHDLNNILSVAMGLASAVQVKLDADDPLMHDVAGILAACRKGRDLTSNLLGFAHRGKAARERFSLNQAVSEVTELLRRTIPKGITVETRLDSDLAEIEGDAGQINNVLVNLALNAAHAMQGRGTLTFITRNEILDVAAGGLLPGAYVQLQVVDTGVGMDVATRQHAFEPFFTTKPKGEGTGLGLATVHAAVQQHGGKVRLESAPGRGTRITIYLPALERSGRRITPKPVARRQVQTGAGTILFVDDEAMIRASGMRMLETLGYQVLLAENGRVAIDIYQRHREAISLVILDLVMPVMDGPETFHRLKELDPGVRILLTSGYTREWNIDPLLVGAAGFIPKPYDIEQLSEKLYQALDHLAAPLA